MNTEKLISQINYGATPEEAIAAINLLVVDSTQELTIINTLIQAINHHHPSVRSAAVKALIKLGSVSVQPLITAYANSGDQGLQAYIIQALAEIAHPEALDLLVEVVGTNVANHCQGNVRRIAARGLGRIACKLNDPTVLHQVQEKLIWALTTPEDWGLRYTAAVSLQDIATPAAQAALQQAIAKETDQVVCSRVAIALEGVRE
ncbi:HEAT repeat domain-containing protein [Nostoc sp. TCL26-01]|uniref:HEAT repeat domain-containing protein n=1 Tax=Nostoc sp. TCL26-01 TaxID=2576904 RepID=UPI0015B7D790|nr:HEAT repeat domain-containing protein [Nostoc sp. TCL26-01]QLE59033.1 HEAT repeat domain-containing protein [Nostoc sp. TCL26-01]